VVRQWLAWQLPRARAADPFGIDQVLDDTEVTTLVDRGFRGLAKARAHWHAPTGDRRTKDQRTTAERAYNRCQAGLRALVEQSIGHLATAWSPR
jgi:hypothetical protein